MAGLTGGSAALRDVLQVQASYVRGTFDEVAALLRREIRVDPTFAPFVRACTAAGATVTVVSSGIEPIVRGRLDDVGLSGIRVIANGIEPRAGGWRIRFRDSVPNGTDKAAVVRAAAAHGARTVFICDGESDYDAALVADRCFAKAGSVLAAFLTQRGRAFAPFRTFADVRFPFARSSPEDT